jgi:hypothetical protein
MEGRDKLLIDMMDIVGPLPQHSPHPQHPWRVSRCDLLGPPVQEESIPRMGWFGIRCWKGLGGV